MHGEWSGHHHHIFVFVADSLTRTDKKIKDLEKEVEVLSHGLLRLHSL
jgi:archaellum component FlaC